MLWKTESNPCDRGPADGVPYRVKRQQEGAADPTINHKTLGYLGEHFHLNEEKISRRCRNYLCSQNQNTQQGFLEDQQYQKFTRKSVLKFGLWLRAMLRWPTVFVAAYGDMEKMKISQVSYLQLHSTSHC